MNPNPFKPTAGKRPPMLIGRESVVEDFEEGLDNGAGAPGRLMLITGNRGCGKTVLLRELQRLASERGWAVVSDSASLGLCDRLADALRSNKPVVTSMEFGPSFGRMSVEAARAKGETLRGLVNERLKKLGPGKGILFAIDEAQSVSIEELAALAVLYQQVLGDQDATGLPDSDQRGLALAFAGLPSMVDDLLEEPSVTFLRRAQQRIFLLAASLMFLTSSLNALAVFNSLERMLACWIRNMMFASYFSLITRWKASSPLAGLALPKVWPTSSEVEITPSATFTAGIVTSFFPTLALNSKYNSDLAISGT